MESEWLNFGARFTTTSTRAVHGDACLESDHNVRISVVRMVCVMRKRGCDIRAAAHQTRVLGTSGKSSRLSANRRPWSKNR
jgi:hypothetical protein